MHTSVSITYVVLSVLIIQTLGQGASFIPNNTPTVLVEASKSFTNYYVLHAIGNIYYTCANNTNGTWIIAYSNGTLANQINQTVGSVVILENSTVFSSINSTIAAAPVNSTYTVASPDGNSNLPWQWMAVSTNVGPLSGVFANITNVMRLTTRGGAIPTTQCFNQTTNNVTYTAVFLFFWNGNPLGETSTAATSSNPSTTSNSGTSSNTGTFVTGATSSNPGSTTSNSGTSSNTGTTTTGSSSNSGTTTTGSSNTGNTGTTTTGSSNTGNSGSGSTSNPGAVNVTQPVAQTTGSAAVNLTMTSGSAHLMFGIVYLVPILACIILV